MKKITVFVACHKPADVHSDDMYRPIQVGKALSTNEMNMIGDDTGDNISKKNPLYSELTAQYWAWKNYHDSEYIGFCHYRRYFAKGLAIKDIERTFRKGTDVILVGPCLRRHGRWSFLKTFVCSEDLAIMQMVINKLYPDYYQTLSLYANDYLDYPLNMFICRRDVFEDYAKWIFSILFECEKYIKLSPYSRARRVYGYLAEFLLPVYFKKNGYKIKSVQYYSLDRNLNTGGIPFRRKLLYYALKCINFREKTKELYIDYSVSAGLQNDMIII